MSKSRKANNVEARLRQQVLTGWSGFGKPKGYSPGTQETERIPKTSANFWQQKSYIAFIPVIIEPTGVHSDGNEYAIQIAVDVDIPIHTYSRRGKSVSKQVHSIPGEKGKAYHKIPVVYGIQPDGNDTLSHPTGYTTVQAVANTYSSFLGKVATTLKCLLLNSQGETPSTENARQREESTQSSKDLGEPTTSRRSSQIRAKVRNEAVPKEPAKLDEANGKVLGDRQGNRKNRLLKVGDDTSK